MKILFLVGSLEGGGVPNVLLTLLTGLVNQNHQVHIAVCWGDDCALGNWDIPGVSTYILSRKKKRVLFSYASMIAKLSEKINPAIIVSFSTFTNLIMASPRISFKAPLICVQHNNISKMFGSNLRGIIKRYVIRRSFTKAHLVTAVSQGVASDIKSLCHRRSRIRIGHIYNGLDINRIQLKAQRALPKEHGKILSEKSILLSAGRLSEQKNYKALIRSFASSKLRHISKLVIIGDGPERSDLESLIRALRLEGEVFLLGWVKNPYQYMRHSDVYLQCSLWEGLPTVLVEAMCCGTVVVASDCPSGPREIIEHEKSGILVKPEDCDALLRAAYDLLQSETKMSEFRKNGFLRAIYFSDDKMVANYNRLFCSILEC